MSLPTLKFVDGAGQGQWSPAHQIGAVGTGTSAASGTYVSAVSRDTGIATYMAGGSILVANMAASLTDLIGLRGSATKIVRVKKIRLEAGATTGAQMAISLKKHTVANTSGTLVATEEVALDSGSAAATATALVYSANPTIDASAVILAGCTLCTTALTTAPGVVEFDFVNDIEAAGVLRGVAQEIVINFGGTTPGAGAVINWFAAWSEESES